MMPSCVALNSDFPLVLIGPFLFVHVWCVLVHDNPTKVMAIGV